MAGVAGAGTPGNLESREIWGDALDSLETELAELSTEQIRQRSSMLTNNMRVIQKELRNLDNQVRTQEGRIKENEEKIKLNKALPYLVANVVEVRMRFHFAGILATPTQLHGQ
jgi:26S proteasome regulatory subunit T5